MTNILQNLRSTILLYVTKMTLQFIVRVVFLQILTIEYLGLNGLFTNIIEILSLTELGIGPAIVYSLYKPLSENNIPIIQSLMYVFKKAYRLVGCFILVVGAALIPWLDFFVKSQPDIYGFQVIYYLFVFDTGISYFYSYKRNLLIADKKQYIVNNIQLISQILLGVLQIIALFLTKSYWSFLFLKIIDTLLENLYLSRIVDRIYPYLNRKNIKPIPKEIKVSIITNIKAMILHKIGGIAVFSTSNILISKFIGIAVVGTYSNYYMIIRAIDAIGSQAFSSLTANIGHVYLTNDKSEMKELFEKIFIVMSFVAFLISVNLFVNINMFISLWLGPQYIFDLNILVPIVLAFYITFIRKPILVLKDAMGLFWNDRYKPIVEAILNLCLGYVLVNNYGLEGILWSIVITSIAIPLWFEPYVVMRNGFIYSSLKYSGHIFKGILITSILTLLCHYLCDYLFLTDTILHLIFRVVISSIVSLIIWCLFYSSNDIVRNFFYRFILIVFKR